jgi:hypothetical protein
LRAAIEFCFCVVKGVACQDKLRTAVHEHELNRLHDTVRRGRNARSES